MTERFFRISAGLTLLFILFMKWDYVFYGYIFVLIFEGTTNLRIPILITRWRYGRPADVPPARKDAWIKGIEWESERLFRFIIVIFLVPAVYYSEALWFLPWFVGFGLTMTGSTNFCHMTTFLLRVGFR